MGMSAFVADHLFLAPLLKARLDAQVPELPCEAVETTEQLLAADKRTAVLMVMWAGDSPGDSAGRGASQMLRQRWLVVVGLNNAGPAETRQLRAGPLMSRVHRAIAGWAPEGANGRTFQRALAPVRPEFTPLKALYPLGFEIQLSL